MGLKDFVKISKIKKLQFIEWELDHYKKNHLEKLYEIGSSANKHGGGIYRMYDNQSKIIYVGKSNDIHRRLLQHVGKRTNTAYFIDEVDYIEYFIENDPAFQTMLEGIFIAWHEPKYNDEIKDRSKLK